MEPYAFADAARCNILLVPVQPIKRSTFATLSALVRHFPSLRLADIPPDPRGERAAFSTSPTSRGRIHFRYLTSYPRDHGFLEEFQLHRKIMGIIGITDCSEWTVDRGGLAASVMQFEKEVSRHPRTLATRCYGFYPVEGQQDNVDGLVQIPNVGDMSFYISTLLTDFASSVLYELSNMYAALESRSTVETPRETQIPNPFEFLPNRPSAHTSISMYTTKNSNGSSSPVRGSSTPVPRKGTPPAAPPPRQPHVNMLSPSLSLAPPSQARTALGIGGNQPGNQEGFLYGKSINSQPLVQVMTEEQPSVKVDAKARRRFAGRLRKLEADLSFLAGRVSEAVAAYRDAAASCKSWNDSVWQAASLEGLAVAKVFQVWSRDKERRESGASTPPTADSATTPAPTSTPQALTPDPAVPYPSAALQAEILELFNQSLTIYQRCLATPETSVISSGAPPEVVHPLVYAEACIRCARFLYCCASEATDPGTALATAVKGSPLPPLGPKSVSPAFASRSAIAQSLGLGYTPQLASQTKVPDRIRLLGTIAHVYGAIGYRRKEAWLLREAAAVAADAVARRRGAPAEGSAGDASPAAGPSVVKTQIHESTGNESLIKMLEVACAAFGVPVISQDRMYRTAEQSAKDRRASMLSPEPVDLIGSAAPTARFGWLELQVGVVRDAITVTEILPDHQGALRFTITALRELAGGVEPAEQFRLSQSIPRIFASAGRRGVQFDLDYWGPKDLLMALEVAPLPARLEPFEHPLVHADATATSGASLSLTKRDPFIFNPNRGKGKGKAIEPLLIENETAEFRVTLQNPFLFDLEVQSIELSVSGSAFAAIPLTTSIPPASYHTIRLLGTPSSPGLVTVRGCKIRLAGCSPREFILPLWSEEDEAKRRKRRSLHTQLDRPKALGLAAQGRRESIQTVGAPERYLQCEVIPSMPLLRLNSTSLIQGALMLYDGETAVIRLVVENTSMLPVDFIKFTFQDSHTTAMRIAILDGGLPASEVYEIESDLLNRPVFLWQKAHTPSRILPGQTVTFSVAVLGKLGCTGGSVQIDYACLGQAAVLDAPTFHTRQITCDIFMTVHRTLEAKNLDISILQPAPKPDDPRQHRKRSASVTSISGVTGRRAAVDPRLEDSLRNAEEGEHCLVSVDVKNVYGQAFDVTFERTEDDDDAFRIRQRVEPGATVAMILRIDRLLLAPEKVAEEVPSLSDRQFVVDRGELSKAEGRRAKALFWYREELLKRIKGSWQEVGSMRHGSISMRSLQLSYPMLETLRIEEVDIAFRITANEDSFDTMKPSRFAKKPIKAQETRVPSNEFLNLDVVVSNNGLRPLRLTFSLSLKASDDAALSNSNRRFTRSILPSDHLSRYVLFDGATAFALPLLQPKQKSRHVVPVCFLAKGKYELGGRVEEVVVVAAEEPETERAAGEGYASCASPLLIHST